MINGGGMPVHSVSVAAAVVDDEGRVLVLRRRDDGHWEPPGGVLEIEESIIAGVRRETREETGLDVRPEVLTGVYKNLTRGIVALVFRCTVIGGALTLNDEADDFQWLERAELADRMTQPFAVRLRDALDYVGTPAVRSHDGSTILADTS